MSSNLDGFKKEKQQWAEAEDLKKKIEDHNAEIRKLELAYRDLAQEGKKGEFGKYDALRLKSDKEKLEQWKRELKAESMALEEQARINGRLCDYYNRAYNENEGYLHELDERLTDKDQIININNMAYQRKDFWLSLLVVFVWTQVVVLALVVLSRFGWVGRDNLILIIIFILLGYLAYLIYQLIQARYFWGQRARWLGDMGDVTLQRCFEDCPADDGDSVILPALVKGRKICG